MVSPSIRPSHQNRVVDLTERQMAARVAMESTQQKMMSLRSCFARKRSLMLVTCMDASICAMASEVAVTLGFSRSLSR